MRAWDETDAYMEELGINVTTFDVTSGDFRFDISPVDFCYCTDFGHMHDIEEIKRAFVCINQHLRDGGCLIVETGLGISREEWLAAFKECGFEIVGEYENRMEAIKSTAEKERYNPAIDLFHLQMPIYRYENVEVYNDNIALEYPNDGRGPKYHFCIKADGKWVGWIDVKMYYSIRCYHDGQIGYMIEKKKDRNHGYTTKALLAIKPFLRQSGFKRILINTDANNLPSRRVCEKIGAKLIETFDTPKWTNLYKQGQRRGCMHEWIIEEETNQPV